MHLLIVMPEIYYGGAETQFRLLIERLDKRKYKITVVVECSGNKENRSEDELFERRNPGVTFVWCEGLYSQNGRLKRLVSASKLRGILKRLAKNNKYDAALVYSALGMRTAPVLKRRGIDVIYSERNSGDYSKFGMLRRMIYLKSCVALTCNSIGAKTNFNRHGIECIQINNGIDIERYYSARERVGNSSNLRILVPARISKTKNQEVVIRAIPYMRDLVKEVVFVGLTTDEDYFDALKVIVAKEKLDAVVKFAGFSNDMVAEYEKADFVILPSFSEGTPNVVLESYASRRICLASDIEMNRAIVLDKRFLFDPTRPEELAQKIRFAQA